MKHQIEYSKQAGKSRSYMSSYKYSRNLDKDIPNEKLFKMYLEEKNEQEKVLLEIQEMYFQLKDHRDILCFYRFLENKNIYCHANTFRNALYNAFKQTEYMRQVEHIKRLKQVIKAYEEWVNDNR